jgi:peptidoglycan/LPS O-acetylase OafA/YrhL
LTARPARQPDLDALRAVAALGVFASHLPWFAYFGHPSTQGWLGALVGGAPLLGVGGFAVCIFVIISGVALTRLLTLKAPAYLGYVRARFGNLFGTYWAIAVPVLAYVLVAGIIPAEWWKVALWLAGLGFLTPETLSPPIGSWWYIGLAWQVIVTAPLVVWGIRRFGAWVVVGVAGAVALSTCFVLVPLGIAYAEKTLVVCRILEVVAGAMLACELWPEVGDALGVDRRTAGLAMATTGALLAGLAFAGLGGRWVYRAVAVALVGGVMYARVIERSGKQRAARLACWLGGLSFVFYLVHEAVIKALWGSGVGPGVAPFAVGTAVALVLSTAIAVLFTKGAARLRASRVSRAGAGS